MPRLEKKAKIIEYFEVVELIRSSNPININSPDRYNLLCTFRKEKDAVKLKQEKEKELSIALKASPMYPYTHTEYIARKKVLKLE